MNGDSDNKQITLRINPEVAKTLEDLANVLRKLGRSNEAVVLDVQAREIRAKRS